MTPRRAALLFALAIVWAGLFPRLPRFSSFGAYGGAVGALRAIADGQRFYAAACANDGYAVDLADLARPQRGSPTGFIEPGLHANGVVRSGYAIRLARSAAEGVAPVGTAAGTCNGAANAPATGYFASADPLDAPSKWLHFAVDERGIIFESRRAIANPLPRRSPFRDLTQPSNDRMLATDAEYVEEVAVAGALMAIPCLFVLALKPFTNVVRAAAGAALGSWAVTIILPAADASSSRFDAPIAFVILALVVVLMASAVIAAIRAVARRFAPKQP